MSKSTKPKITEHTVYQVTEHDGSKHVFATRKEALACVKAIAAPLYRVTVGNDYDHEYGDQDFESDEQREKYERDVDNGTIGAVYMALERSLDGGNKWDVKDSCFGIEIRNRKDCVEFANYSWGKYIKTTSDSLVDLN